MGKDSEHRKIARLLRERAGFEMGCVFKELYNDCGTITTCEECNERAMRYVADLLDPPDYMQSADEDGSSYADAEAMQGEINGRYRVKVGSVTLASNNGYDLLDAMLEIGA